MPRANKDYETQARLENLEELGHAIKDFEKTVEEQYKIREAKKAFNKVLFRVFGTKRPTSGLLQRHFGGA